MADRRDAKGVFKIAGPSSFHFAEVYASAFGETGPLRDFQVVGFGFGGRIEGQVRNKKEKDARYAKTESGKING